MKVLQLIHTQGHGGAENTFRWLAWGLRREGIDVIAAVPEATNAGKENWITPALEELAVPYVSYDKSGSPWQLLRNMDRLIQTVAPDVVHSHLLDSNFYSSIACRRRSIPHVCTEHGDLLLGHSSLRRFKYLIISFCTSFLACVSEAVRVEADRVLPLRGKLGTVYNGISFIEPGASSFRREFSIPEKSILIGNVGNLYPVKGQKFLVRAFAELLAEHPDAYLVIVGRGGEERALREQVRELGVPSGKVIFTGFRGDVGNILNALDLYVQPSLSEGHPLAVLEAMSLGVPVIASEVGGLPELLQNGHGTMTSTGDWRSIHSALRDFIRRPEVFRQQAAAARTHVHQTFCIERMTRQYIEIYQKSLSPGRTLLQGGLQS